MTQLADVAGLFDQYRQHYGEPAAPAQTLAWLTRHTRSRQLTIFTAHRGLDLVGLATTVTVPASLQLGCFWQLRDLYVTPSARRCGAGRALLHAVRQAATAARATRLSVQTEPAEGCNGSEAACAGSPRVRILGDHFFPVRRRRGRWGSPARVGGGRRG